MDILYESLQTYYNGEGIIEKYLNILNGKHKISLRIIDWFVTNYSKKNNIYYTIYKNKNGEKTFEEKDNEFIKQFNTYQSYKSQLKSYSKKKFDPFCRRERISFKYDDNNALSTTLGQLNFFKWAIDNLIIEYILENISDIEDDMNKSYNMGKKVKENNIQRKKRQELSKSASRGLNTQKMNIVLEFN